MCIRDSNTTVNNTGKTIVDGKGATGTEIAGNNAVVNQDVRRESMEFRRLALYSKNISPDFSKIKLVQLLSQNEQRNAYHRHQAELTEPIYLLGRA